MNLKIFIFYSLPLLLAACSQNDAPMADMLSTATTTGTANKSNNFVSLDEALTKGEEAFKGIYGKSTRSEKLIPFSVELWDMSNVTTRATDNDMKGFYIVNYSGGGFSILSSDNRREAVFAISDKGHINLADTVDNKGLSWYLNEGIPLMDDALSANNAPLIRDTTLHRLSTTNYIPVSPCRLSDFLSEFSQGMPYNAYCFTPDGRQSVVGCAPLAVGTICGYFKHPQSHQGYSFDWEQMYSNPSHENWARLFSLIGKSGNMNASYNANYTGASPLNFVRTFTNLGFKNHRLDSFSPSIVNSELRASRPVVTYGYDPAGGHAWIIDGGYMYVTVYNDDDLAPVTDPQTITKYYFHCIWGWGGYANAYYLYDDTLGGQPDSRLNGESGYCPYEFGSLGIVYGYEKE